MRERWERRVSWPLWSAVTALFLVFIVVVLPAQASQTVAIAGTSESPDTSYLYGPADLERLAEEYGQEGRDHYVRSRFTFDVVWPLVYGAFLQVSLLLASRSTLRRLPSAALWLPASTVAFDLLENTTASIVMARFPQSTPIVAHAAPVFTFLKWNLLVASFVLVILGGVLGVGSIVRGRR